MSLSIHENVTPYPTHGVDSIPCLRAILETAMIITLWTMLTPVISPCRSWHSWRTTRGNCLSRSKNCRRKRCRLRPFSAAVSHDRTQPHRRRPPRTPLLIISIIIIDIMRIFVILLTFPQSWAYREEVASPVLGVQSGARQRRIETRVPRKPGVSLSVLERDPKGRDEFDHFGDRIFLYEICVYWHWIPFWDSLLYLVIYLAYHHLNHIKETVSGQREWWGPEWGSARVLGKPQNGIALFTHYLSCQCSYYITLPLSTYSWTLLSSFLIMFNLHIVCHSVRIWTVWSVSDS